MKIPVPERQDDADFAAGQHDSQIGVAHNWFLTAAAKAGDGPGHSSCCALAWHWFAWVPLAMGACAFRGSSIPFMGRVSYRLDSSSSFSARAAQQYSHLALSPSLLFPFVPDADLGTGFPQRPIPRITAITGIPVRILFILTLRRLAVASTLLTVACTFGGAANF